MEDHEKLPTSPWDEIPKWPWWLFKSAWAFLQSTCLSWNFNMVWCEPHPVAWAHIISNNHSFSCTSWTRVPSTSLTVAVYQSGASFSWSSPFFQDVCGRESDDNPLELGIPWNPRSILFNQAVVQVSPKWVQKNAVCRSCQCHIMIPVSFVQQHGPYNFWLLTWKSSDFTRTLVLG